MLLLSVTLIALVAVLVPALLIQPFKLQTAERLKISYALHHWSPIITLLALAFALLIGISLWNQTRGWWRRTCLVFLFLPLLVATWFARQNHFEWMFKPLPNAGFANANDTGFVSEGDMVLAVELNGDAAAYPVRQVAYHHVVQDTIGGIPALVTY
jgi:phosphoglycerol transferase MdoB-like AlkP superfamily enzyme